MFIYDTVNFIFTKISAEFYKNAHNQEGLERGGGLDRIKNVIIQSLQFYAQFAKIIYCNWLKVLNKSII